jgi:hypothetical protein
MAAQSLSRSASYLGARYRSLRGRLGGPRAIQAMARYLACLLYRLLTKGKAYVDRGTAHYERGTAGKGTARPATKSRHSRLYARTSGPTLNPFHGQNCVSFRRDAEIAENTKIRIAVCSLGDLGVSAVSNL